MTIDHLVYAVPELESGIADLEARLGVRAAIGGRHQGRGTWNALIALSEFSYLEIIAPDPAQPDVPRPRWFGVDDARGGRLVAWAAKAANVDQVAADAARRGVTLGPVISGSRQTSDGTTLHWRCTDPRTIVEDGIVPFFIDWGDSEHPAAGAPRGPVLISLRAEHPEPRRVDAALAALGVRLPVSVAARAGLVALLRTSHGDVELR